MPELTDDQLDELLDAIGLHVPHNLPAECGTEAAYQRHLRRGQEPDQACRDAHAAHHRQPCTPDASRRQPIAHGTLKGYKQHRYRQEAACEPCLAAARDYQRDRTERS